MDGTGRLFRPFLEVLPPDIVPSVVSYPADIPLTYAQTEELVWKALPREGEFALLGESYSGPIALRIAARRPQGLRAVVLAASFALAPSSKAAAAIGLLRSWPFRIPPPDWLINKLLLGPGAPAPLVSEFKQVVRQVGPKVLARRLRDILAVDVREELKACPYPILCLAASEDRLVPQHIYWSMAALRPDLELVRMSGPHCLLPRYPAAAADHIRRFLCRVFERTDNP